MHVLAFEYTQGWGNLLTAAVAVVSVVATAVTAFLNQRSNRKAEKERAEEAAKQRADDRGHERELREIELRAELRARHYAGRQPAYQALGRKYLDYRRAQAASNQAFTALRSVSMVGVPVAEDVREAHVEFEVAARQTSECQEEFEAALADVGAVASRVVYEAAAYVERCVRDLGIRQRTLELADPKNPLDMQEANLRIREGWEALEAAEEALRRAIRTELELDDQAGACATASSSRGRDGVPRGVHDASTSRAAER